jgi:uncharacterized protein HemX
MKREFFFRCLLSVFLILVAFGLAVSSYASVQGRNDLINEEITPEFEKEGADRADHLKSSLMNKNTGRHSDLLQWNLDVDNKTFQVTVNRNEETITIRGEAEDWEQKDKVEHVLKARAPHGFQIINEIDISQTATRERG